jgi:D-beta-D-heptose 7-phosphate kinase/D-beta-D-heptose 1-phosphate adenosyltransferase
MKTIFVNGCFDVLHRGHIELFAYAKSLGDKLIVGIDADSRVKSMKGPSRPFNNEKDRKYILESVKYIDEVHVFDSSNELENLIKKVKPDTMVVGDDWKDKIVVGSQYSGNVVFFKKLPGYSTTNILTNNNEIRN